MTNGLYACETWNYTTTDIVRLERHYFRLLRDTLLLPKNDPDITFVKVLDMAEEQGIYTVFPMECLIQRQQLKFLWKITHLKDTAVQKMILFGKVANKGKQRRGGRKQTYISCLNLALSNFGVTMDDCGKMDQTDWDFLMDNEALVRAVERWRVQPRAKKPIDNFWAPQIRTRGKRKLRNISEDEVDGAGSGEETAVEQSTLLDQSIPMNTESIESNHQENISLQTSGNNTRGQRKKHKKLRKGDGSHYLVQSTQDFPTSGDSGTTTVIAISVDSAIAAKNDQPLLGKPVTEENRIANERAVENFMRRIDNLNMIGEENRIERRTTTVANSNPNQTVTSDIRRYKNFQRKQRRAAEAERKKQHVARRGDATEPLQLFIGEATTVDRRPNAAADIIIWEHRARLAQTRL